MANYMRDLRETMPDVTDPTGRPVEVLEYRGVLAVVTETGDQRTWMPSHYATMTAPWIMAGPAHAGSKIVDPCTRTVQFSCHGEHPMGAVREWVDEQLAPDDPKDQSWARLQALRRRYLAGIERWQGFGPDPDSVSLPSDPALKG